jgi:cytochrome c peroxidase
MRKRHSIAVLVAAVVGSLFVVGAVTAAGPASAPMQADNATNSSEAAETAQTDDTDYPVEPPTDRALPTYEEVRQPGDTEQKIRLGAMLYHDPRISETGSISCNSCHNVMEGGDGSRTVGRGVHGQTGPRNSPTVWNAAFMATQFWDGRANTLAQQAKGPITAGVEMGMPSSEAAMDRIRGNPGYVELYEEVYGGENPVTLNNTVDAIAAYERTLITPNSSYDEYVNGDTDALTQEQLDGMEHFNELGCASCHSGPAFNGPQWKVATGEREYGNGYYRQLGVFSDSNQQCANYIEQYNLYADSGRAGVTGDDSDEYMFKVPTLRNTEITAPYYHNGQIRELDTAVKVMASCQLDENINNETADEVTAFLNSTTGEFPEQTMPRLPSKAGGPPMIPDDAGEASDPGSGDGGDDTGSVGTPATPAETTTTSGPSGSSPLLLVAVTVAAIAAAVGLIGAGLRQID